MDQDPDSLDTLAVYFRALSELLSEYSQTAQDLSGDQQTAIQNAAQTLLTYSLNLTTSAVQSILDNTKASLENIARSTSQAQAAIANINTIKNIIAAIASIIELSNAVANKDPLAIARGVDNIISML